MSKTRAFPDGGMCAGPGREERRHKNVDGEGGELVFRGDRVSVWDDGKVLETERGDDCTTV